ncbi:MAG TPA: CDP-alcohol phosphatidyltransferase family protein [Gemmataceae bacterium]|nr:CDP-alcohol phosphatidyltransferase family protein [Gemmataceae bacterium]
MNATLASQTGATSWRDTCTIPNALTVSRLALGLCFPLFPPAWRLPVVAMAIVTDMLDGAAGRRFGICSQLGRVLDPIADKIFLAGVLGTLLWEGTVGIGELALVGVRDIVVIAGTLVGLALRAWPTFERMAPSWPGKIATAAQFGFFLVLLATPEYKEDALIVTAILNAIAGVHYIWLFATNGSVR